MSQRHTGEAENVSAGGAKEIHRNRVNAPFRDLHLNGHELNESYKNPVASVLGDSNATNHSYLHPLSHANKMPPAPWAKASSIKPMSEAGAGKAGRTIT
jgi:hypothetical protein